MMPGNSRLLVALSGIWVALELGLSGVPIVHAATAGANHQMVSPGFIKSLQHELKRAGYDPGVTDGKMGPATRNALRRFQEANDLPPTGDPDIPTLTKLLSQGLPR